MDEEYSDCSGIAFTDYELICDNVNFTNYRETLPLKKHRYADSGDYYWEVVWTLNDYEDDVFVYEDYEIVQLFTKEEKTALLTIFLRQFRETKAFENIDLEWLEEIYTGIEENRHRIGDILWE